jgi:hypothetical protein
VICRGLAQGTFDGEATWTPWFSLLGLASMPEAAHLVPDLDTLSRLSHALGLPKSRCNPGTASRLDNAQSDISFIDPAGF